MKKWNLTLSFILLTLVFQANAALVSRLNGLAFYDTEADLTWLKNANITGDPKYWEDANNIVANLNIAGITGWRLPTSYSTAPSCDGAFWGYNCSGSEIGNMFYNVLGGKAGSSISSVHNANYDLFENIKDNIYWGSDYVADGQNLVSVFSTMDGLQGTYFRENNYQILYSWAVYTGDVSTVPIPAPIWLFSAGIMILFNTARKK